MHSICLRVGHDIRFKYIKVILRVQYFRKYLFKIATNLNLWIPTPQDFPKNSCISSNLVKNVARRRPWRNAGPGETVTAGHVPVSHQDVALFIRSFADLGSESSSARKNPRSRKDTSTVTPSESDSAVRARLRYAGPCHQIRLYP